MSVEQAREHSEHIAHAGHGDRWAMSVGITMTILGVMLAFSSALVGSERTLLVQKRVAQQNAHAKYQAQDVKHRVSFLALAQVHATAFGVPSPTVNKDSRLKMAQSDKTTQIEAEFLHSIFDWAGAKPGAAKAQ